MTTHFIAWSHSRLKTFKDCPKQFYHLNVPKKGAAERVPYEETAAMKAGNAIDNALTSRISGGEPLPPEYAPFEPMAQAVLDTPGTKLTQAKFALDQALTPCGYMDWDRTWVRVVYDVAVINGERAWIGDWKNGKIFVDEQQLRLFATIGFHQFPEVQVIDTAFVWLQHGTLSPKTYYRQELPELWGTFLPDVERLQTAFRNNHWPAEPKNGAKTCQWCPVNKAGRCDRAAGPYGYK